MLLVLLPHNPALLAHISPAHSDTATQEERELLSALLYNTRDIIPQQEPLPPCVAHVEGVIWERAGAGLGGIYYDSSRGKLHLYNPARGRDGINLFLLDLS